MSAAEKVTEGLQGAPSHGIGVTPDGKTLWRLSKMNTRDLLLLDAGLEVASPAIEGRPSSRLADVHARQQAVYVANAGSNSVSVVDIAARKEVDADRVGQVPKRNITAVLP